MGLACRCAESQGQAAASLHRIAGLTHLLPPILLLVQGKQAELQLQQALLHQLQLGARQPAPLLLLLRRRSMRPWRWQRRCRSCCSGAGHYWCGWTGMWNTQPSSATGPVFDYVGVQ